MPHFIILPLYALLLLGLIVVAIMARSVPRASGASGYLMAGAVGTVPGFLVANVLNAVAGLLPVWADQRIAMRP